MQRFQEHFDNSSPSDSTWDRITRAPTWSPRGDILSEQEKDRLSRSRSRTSVTLYDAEISGIECVLHSDKEVVLNHEPGSPISAANKPHPRRRCLILALITAAILIAMAVGIGVAFGTQNSKSQPDNLVPDPTTMNSTIDASISYSTTGAFNGTGIAVASQSFGEGGHGDIVMYFQHHTGEIRFAQLTSEGTWRGGSSSEVLADNAKNATPISAVSYAKNGTASWHLFYIDDNNMIRERIQDNTTHLWRDGPLNDLNIQTLDHAAVGLQACWYGNFYGDAEYDHSPIPSGNGADTTFSDQNVGIHLWYGATNTSFKEVGWTYGDTYWTEKDTLYEGYNGYAGVGCYTWGPGSVSYLIMVNVEGELEIMWRDLNTSLTGTASHPIDVWTTALTIPDIYPTSSLGYTNILYAQNTDLGITGYNISWAAENTSIVAEDSFVINGAKGLPGTHLTCTALPDNSGGDSLLVFYQTNGSDITEFVRDFEQGQWTSLSVPIPST